MGCLPCVECPTQNTTIGEGEEEPGTCVVYCTAMIVFVKKCIFMCIVGCCWSAVDRDRLLTGDGC